MNRRDVLGYSLVSALSLPGKATAEAQRADDPDSVLRWAIQAAYSYRHYPNHERDRLAGPDIVYGRAANIDLRLDVFTAGSDTAPRPTLIYFHGGGWVHLRKEDRTLYLLPYLAQGMNAVNVEYRVANQSPAPAAIEDCRTALHWVYAHADEYGFDRSKLVVAGESAGGHLALMTAMVDPNVGFDDTEAFTVGNGSAKVAAIVNFFGITDVAELLQDPHPPSWVLEWFAGVPNSLELARRCSPLSHVRAGLPPIITLHGDRDPAVPYGQALRLHEALDRASVPNELITIPGGGHGAEHWPPAEQFRAQLAVFSFLRKHSVLPDEK